MARQDAGTFAANSRYANPLARPVNLSTGMVIALISPQSAKSAWTCTHLGICSAPSPRHGNVRQRAAGHWHLGSFCMLQGLPRAPPGRLKRGAAACTAETHLLHGCCEIDVAYENAPRIALSLVRLACHARHTPGHARPKPDQWHTTRSDPAPLAPPPIRPRARTRPGRDHAGPDTQKGSAAGAARWRTPSSGGSAGSRAADLACCPQMPSPAFC